MKIAFLDREFAVSELITYTRTLLARDEQVLSVGLFGSLARGDALPSSDADLLLALKTHSMPRWFDRIPEYAADFSGASLPTEPFPFTVEELARMATQPGFLRTALRELVPLGGDAHIWEQLRTGAF